MHYFIKLTFFPILSIINFTFWHVLNSYPVSCLFDDTVNIRHCIWPRWQRRESDFKYFKNMLKIFVIITFYKMHKLQEVEPLMKG